MALKDKFPNNLFYYLCVPCLGRFGQYGSLEELVQHIEDMVEYEDISQEDIHVIYGVEKTVKVVKPVTVKVEVK